MIIEVGPIITVDDGVEATSEPVIGGTPKSGCHLGACDPWPERDRLAFVEEQESGEKAQSDRLPIVTVGGGSVGPALDLAGIETTFGGSLGKVEGLDLAVTSPSQP